MMIFFTDIRLFILLNIRVFVALIMSHKAIVHWFSTEMALNQFQQKYMKLCKYELEITNNKLI